MHIRFIANFLLEIDEPLGNNREDNIWDAARKAVSFRLKA